MDYDDKIKGYVHSIYTGGMVDGPGIRCVVFLAGCGLRCKYCHNPDTWNRDNGNIITVDDCLAEILKYEAYYKFSGGGVTISGGEPLNQPDFLAELLKACHAHGLHTAIDTSGFTTKNVAEKILPHVDLLLLDIKSYNKDTYKNVTGVSLDNTLDFLRAASRYKVTTWIRFVLVPGLTDNKRDMKEMAEFLQAFDNVEEIHVLPFHKNGEYKWENVQIPYELGDTRVPTQEEIAEAEAILRISR